MAVKGAGVDDRVALVYGGEAGATSVTLGEGESMTFTSQAYIRLTPATITVDGAVTALPLKVAGTPKSVAVAKRVLQPGDVIVQVPPGVGGAGRVEVSAVIPVAHKLALRGLAADEAIIKYGQTIGFATTSILPGQHVHSHNVYLKDSARDYAFGSDVRQLPPPPQDGPQSFQGYARADGRVGAELYRRRGQRELFGQRGQLCARPVPYAGIPA